MCRRIATFSTKPAFSTSNKLLISFVYEIITINNYVYTINTNTFFKFVESLRHI